MTWLLTTNSNASEGISSALIAKIVWLSQLNSYDDASLRGLKCEQTLTVKAADPSVTFIAGDRAESTGAPLRKSIRAARDWSRV